MRAEGRPALNFQMLFEEQDRTLTSIGGVISTLRSQATVMGREVFEQVGCVCC